MGRPCPRNYECVGHLLPIDGPGVCCRKDPGQFEFGLDYYWFAIFGNILYYDNLLVFFSNELYTENWRVDSKTYLAQIKVFVGVGVG